MNAMSKPKRRAMRIIAAGGRAFTLIELLVVISVLALLAALVINLAPAAAEKRIRNTAAGLLSELETAIEFYKSEKGYYPPDNPMDSGRSPLYYELKGAWRDPSDAYEPMAGGQPLTAAQIAAAFGTGGFLNSSPVGADVPPKDFYAGLKEKNVAEDGGIKFLVVPVRGPGAGVNPVHYRKTNPTHNVATYDLWIEAVVGDKTEMISNWE
jgi:prepilin-type N-terminal cleavage/methylation domain-containing protein